MVVCAVFVVVHYTMRQHLLYGEVMKKAITLTIAVLLLTGCGATEKEVTTIKSTSDVQAALEGSAYECNAWEELADDYAKCTMNRGESINGGGVLSVSMTEHDPELFAAVTLDGDDSLVGAVWGDNWIGACSEDVSLEGCKDIAEMLGVEVLPQK